MGDAFITRRGGVAEEGEPITATATLFKTLESTYLVGASGQFGYYVSGDSTQIYVNEMNGWAVINGTNTQVGAIYVYDYDGNLLRKIFNDQTNNTIGFGRPTIGLGDTKKIAAASRSINKVSIIDSLTGNSLATLEPPSGQAGSFGTFIAATTNFVLVGAPGIQTDGRTTGVGYLFSGNNYQLLHTLVPPTSINTGAAMGQNVALSEQYAVLGAWNNNFNDGGTTIGNAGKTYVYNTNNGSLVFEITPPTPVDGGRFGYANAIEGNILAIAQYRTIEPEPLGGVVYVYNLASATPTVPFLTIYNPGEADSPTPLTSNNQFGYFSISLHDGLLGVGDGTFAAQEENPVDPENPVIYNSSGAFYVFDLNSTTPTIPIYSLYNPNDFDTPVGDNFGRLGGFIRNNTILVTGYTEDDSDGEGGTWNSTGRAYMYKVG